MQQQPQDLARPEPGWQLLAKSIVGIVITGVLFIVVLGVFVHLIDGGGSWWFTGHHLTQESWYEAVRNAVASVALSVAGGAAYLAVRRQRTADLTQHTSAEAKQIAAKAQETAAEAYKLSVDQYTLAVQRRADDQVRELRARFAGAAEHLAHTSPAVRIAGVYAMAALAEDWAALDRSKEVQVCIDVLCGYLRLPYSPEHGDDDRCKVVVSRPTVADPSAADGTEAPPSPTTYEEHFEYRQSDRKVRQTIVRVITAHLKEDGPHASSSWSPYDFDFTGAHFEDADFGWADFRGTNTSFDRATFSGENTSFDRATFRGENTSFDRATFSGQTTSFIGATFSGQTTWFGRATFSSQTTCFDRATFSGQTTWFGGATFSGQSTSFDRATFSGQTTSFIGATFSGQTTSFHSATFSGAVTTFRSVIFRGERTVFAAAIFAAETTFSEAKFSAKNTWFDGAIFERKTFFEVATFSGEVGSFRKVTFNGMQTCFTAVTLSGQVSFLGASFSGNYTTFAKADFSRAEIVSFDQPQAWNNVNFSWDSDPALADMPACIRPRMWPPIVRPGS